MNKMTTKGKHLTLNDREFIEESLNEASVFLEN